MGYVLKGSKYRMVDNRSFELPLPVKYELLKEDSTIAEYEISDDQTVSCRIITKYKEEMITPINRPLDISDIYYFFSCRVFQDRTPFTLTELSLLGLEKYNVYDIIRKTRGVTPFDTYWLRFDGDQCDYETARNAWNSLMSQVGGAAQSNAAKPEIAAPKSDADVHEILHQHKIDVAAKFAAEAKAETAKAVLSEPEPVSNNTMSAEEIEALLLKSGLTDIVADEEPVKPEPVEEKPASGGMMSQDAIEAMLAAAGAPEPAAEPEPVEEKPASGGKMSQEDIEKMLAAASGAVENAVSDAAEAVQETLDSAPEAAAPAPVEEKPAETSGGGKMSQADIEALLSGMKEDAAT